MEILRIFKLLIVKTRTLNLGTHTPIESFQLKKAALYSDISPLLIINALTKSIPQNSLSSSQATKNTTQHRQTNPVRIWKPICPRLERPTQQHSTRQKQKPNNSQTTPKQKQKQKITKTSKKIGVNNRTTKTTEITSIAAAVSLALPSIRSMVLASE